MANFEFVALDVEATGLDPVRSEIIEIATVAFSARWIEAPYQSFVRPRKTIPIEIERLTGIRSSDVTDAPILQDIEPMLRRQLGRRVIVGHMVEQDLAYLDASGIAVANPFLDTHALAQLLLPGMPSYSLENLAKSLELEVDGTVHRAGYDAMLTAELMQAIASTRCKNRS